MRDYAKVSPAFWMTGSGKALRGCPEAQIVGLYLVTCPSANMIGLYYLPKALLIHETGLSPEGASKGLARASEAGFAFYDDDSELVWVPNAANYQIGDKLTGKDKRREGVLRELLQFRKHRFSKEFLEKYAEPYGLQKQVELISPSEGPSKALRSQEQEQEQEQAQDQEQKHEQERESATLPRAPSSLSDPDQTGVRKRVARTRPRTGISRGWTPKPETLARYAELGIDASANIPKFIRTHAAKGSLMADWEAAFETWMDNAEKFGELVMLPPRLEPLPPIDPECHSLEAKAAAQALADRFPIRKIEPPSVGNGKF